MEFINLEDVNRWLLDISSYGEFYDIYELNPCVIANYLVLKIYKLNRYRLACKSGMCEISKFLWCHLFGLWMWLKEIMQKFRVMIKLKAFV